jgi:hypothetical protein
MYATSDYRYLFFQLDVPMVLNELVYLQPRFLDYKGNLSLLQFSVKNFSIRAAENETRVEV